MNSSPAGVELAGLRIEPIERFVELLLGERGDVEAGKTGFEAVEILFGLEAHGGELRLGIALAFACGRRRLIGKAVGDRLLGLLGEIPDGFVESLVTKLGEGLGQQAVGLLIRS